MVYFTPVTHRMLMIKFKKLSPFYVPQRVFACLLSGLLCCLATFDSVAQPTPYGKQKQINIDECLTSPANKDQAFADYCKLRLKEGNRAALFGDQQAIDEVNEKIIAVREEKRLKVGFVDVNTVMERLGHSMDWTANWIDGQFAESDDELNKAKAWGHVTIGWEPRDGEWANFPVKFRVRAKLPNLKNKAELILSDNEQEELNTLPYETVRPDALKSSQRSLGAAVRFMHRNSANVERSSRIGWGDGQLYVRSSLLYRKKFFGEKITLTAQPALEYYLSDGIGARFLVDTAYAINPDNEMRFSYSLRDRQDFEAPEWRNGFYSISALSDRTAFIFGLTAAGVTSPDYRPEFYKLSLRYRQKAFRSWIFIEAEPFVEFRRERLVEDFNNGHVYDDFERDVGIALRFEAHYGFL